MRLALGWVLAMAAVGCGSDDSAGAPPGAGFGDAAAASDSAGAPGDGGLSTMDSGADSSFAGDASPEAGAPSLAYVYVASGAYGAHADNSIYGFTVDLKTGVLTPRGTPVPAGNNPTFIAFDKTGAHAYVTNESGDAIAAFAVDPSTRALTLKNRVGSGGAGPTYVALDHRGGHLLVANYTAGNLSLMPIQADGSLAAVTVTKSFGGNAETHCARSDATDAHVLVMNKGLDSIAQYDYDPVAGTLVDHNPATLATAAGSGPRHIDFHPSGAYAYLVSEAASTLTAFTYDGAKGTLTPIQTVSTLPSGFTGTNTGAEVEVAPNGKFVYTSNRGDDSIAVFAIDGATGKVNAIAHTKTGGKNPRHFIIDPSGQLLLAGNIDSDLVTVFAIDASTGLLTPKGSVTVNSPGFVGVLMP